MKARTRWLVIEILGLLLLMTPVIALLCYAIWKAVRVLVTAGTPLQWFAALGVLSMLVGCGLAIWAGARREEEAWFERHQFRPRSAARAAGESEK